MRDDQTLSALSLGTSTLRTVLSAPSLQLDNISELTSALDDQLVAASEVSEAVDAVSGPERQQVDAEVEEEWELLVREEEGREEERRVEEARKRLEEAEGRGGALPEAGKSTVGDETAAVKPAEETATTAAQQERMPAQ